MKSFLFGIVLLLVFSVGCVFSSQPIIKLGDHLPAFSLYKHDGKVINEKDLLGKVIVMNFIFTRCCVPTLCPASTKKMALLQKAVLDNGEGLDKEVFFITFSFDPIFDTPEVLAQYALGYNINFANYAFLTGDQQVIKDLMHVFGVYILSKNGVVNHTVKTLIFDKKGKLVYETCKKDWQITELLKIIKRNLKT